MKKEHQITAKQDHALDEQFAGKCTKQGCLPDTCANANASCGTLSDLCGGTLVCGACGANLVCGNNQCAPPVCTPTSCTKAGASCGPLADGCGGTLDCGSCNAVDTQCQQNQCVVVCGPGLSPCPNGCRDLLHDQSNCGTCGNTCPINGNCVNGACACPNGFILCGNTCTSPLSDSKNCGGCGTICTGGMVCVNGMCAFNT